MTRLHGKLFDALYGAYTHRDEICTLIALPVVQRLRDIRLSKYRLSCDAGSGRRDEV